MILTRRGFFGLVAGAFAAATLAPAVCVDVPVTRVLEFGMAFEFTSTALEDDEDMLDNMASKWLARDYPDVSGRF